MSCMLISMSSKRAALHCRTSNGRRCAILAYAARPHLAPISNGAMGGREAGIKLAVMPYGDVVFTVISSKPSSGGPEYLLKYLARRGCHNDASALD